MVNAEAFESMSYESPNLQTPFPPPLYLLTWHPFNALNPKATLPSSKSIDKGQKIPFHREIWVASRMGVTGKYSAW